MGEASIREGDCAICGDAADVILREMSYCARCALAYTLDRLYEELGVDGTVLVRHEDTRYMRSTAYLPRLGDRAMGLNGQLIRRFRPRQRH
jgi:hypothetical protein